MRRQPCRPPLAGVYRADMPPDNTTPRSLSRHRILSQTRCIHIRILPHKYHIAHMQASKLQRLRRKDSMMLGRQINKRTAKLHRDP